MEVDNTIVDVILPLISTVGFPIFVAVWLLYRDWKIMSMLLEKLEQLNHNLERLVNR